MPKCSVKNEITQIPPIKICKYATYKLVYRARIWLDEYKICTRAQTPTYITSVEKREDQLQYAKDHCAIMR